MARFACSLLFLKFSGQEGAGGSEGLIGSFSLKYPSGVPGWKWQSVEEKSVGACASDYELDVSRALTKWASRVGRAKERPSILHPAQIIKA